MVASYEDFRKELEKMIILRSANYVNSNCDIDTLIDMVYDEIVSNVNLFYATEPVRIDKDTHSYDIKTVDYVEDEHGNLTVPHTYYQDVLQIVDEDYEDVGLYVRVDGYNNITIDSNGFLSDNDGKDIYLRRRIVIDKKYIDIRYYHELKKAMIEGILYHVQSSIPSQQDGQLANLQYQRFYAAIKVLIEKHPQDDKFDIEARQEYTAGSM